MNLFRKKSIDQIQADAAAGFSDAEGGTGNGLAEWGHRNSPMRERAVFGRLRSKTSAVLLARIRPLGNGTGG